jgi:hypothetical protein
VLLKVEAEVFLSVEVVIWREKRRRMDLYGWEGTESDDE